MTSSVITGRRGRHHRHYRARVLMFRALMLAASLGGYALAIISHK
jgi:hypothetical protein